MHIIAGTFTSKGEARAVLSDLEQLGIAPVNTRVIEGYDPKGFAREHRPTRAAALRGSFVGALAGVFIFGALLLIARANFLALRYLALYLCGIAICTAAGAAILACWNLGVSHDEALLFEEAMDKGTVIAAVEVSDLMEEKVIHAMEDHGGRDVRSGLWQPRGWKHAYPAYDLPA